MARGLRRGPVLLRFRSLVDSIAGYVAGIVDTRQLSKVRHRAVATTPPECRSASASLRYAMLPSSFGCGLGLRGLHFRGHLCVHSRYGPVTRRPPFTMAVSMGFKALVSFLLAIQTTGFWLFPRRVCPPLNAPAFAGRTTGRAVFPHPALGRDHAFAHGRLAVRCARRARPMSFHRRSSEKRTYFPARTLCLRQSHWRSRLIACASTAA